MSADGDLAGYRTSIVPGQKLEVNIAGNTIVLEMDNEVGVGGRYVR